jgi:hypothetical protein
LFRVLDLKKGQYAFAKGDVSLGVQASSAQVDLQIWPNPTADQLTVSNDSPLQRIEVWNAAGQLVAAVRPPAGTSQWQFNVEDWDAGTYLVKVNDAPGRAIVVQ